MKSLLPEDIRFIWLSNIIWIDIMNAVCLKVTIAARAEEIVGFKPTSNLGLTISELFTVGASNLTPLPAGMRKASDLLRG